MAHAGMLAIISSADLDGFVYEVAKGLREAHPVIVHGTMEDAAKILQSSGHSPRYVLMDVGSRRDSIIPEIEALSNQCEAGTRVVAIGQVNDIQFYRLLTENGVPDYFPLPAHPDDIIASFRRQDQPTPAQVAATQSAQPLGEVIAFMSAAGGDGASTAALNAAYAMATQTTKLTVLVDLDYQYGMAARNLNLPTQYGTKDLFEHPERGIDSTIIQRMAVHYGPLHVISAPADLRYLPHIDAQAISELIRALRQSYANVVIDLPHVWQPWVAAACREASTLVIVAQLWLKSVSHAARILRACRDQNAVTNVTRIIINRSGAKFKEAVEPKDFERVAGLPISHYLANDIRTVVNAESQAKTIIEVGHNSRLKFDLENLARLLKGQPLEVAEVEKESSSSPLQGLFKRKNG